MLETLRKHSRSIFIYVLFGLLILTFILTFGPQGVSARRGLRGAQSGCGSVSQAAASVGHGEISDSSWRFALLVASGGSPNGLRARQSMLRERILDQLIVREIFVQKAEAMGLHISDQEVRERLTSGEFYFLGTKANGKSRYFIKDDEASEPHFSARALQQFAQSGDFSTVERLVEEQKRDLLAVKVRELVAAASRVSPEEVQSHYQLENTKADIDYVVLSVTQAKNSAQPTAAELDKYVADHEADLKAQFDKEADRWAKRGKEVRVRDLFVKSEKPAPPQPQPQPQPQGDDKPPAAPVADPARAKADAALARLKKGEDFGAVVRAVTPAAPQAGRGGDLGWRPLSALRLGKPVADAVEKLEKGATTEVVEVPEGFHIVQLTDKREGDLSFEQVKRDLAEDAVLVEKAKASAKADAEKALAAVKAGTPLDKLFPADGDAKATGPKLQHATDVTRIGNFIQGLGSAPDVVKAIFDEMQVGDVAPKAYEVSGDFVVVKLTKRDEPDMQKFQAEKLKLAAEMAEQKGQVTVAEMAARECREAKDAGKISYDPVLVEYNEAVDGKTPKISYQPCNTLR
jgi:peptidyl-prolyl cis-trans isomerase D